MDVYQGSYKNGTENTRDYPFFSGIFFCTRLLLVASFYLINSPFVASFIGAIVTVLGFTVAIVHPQRKYKHYLLDCLVLMFISLSIFSTVGYGLQNSNSIPQHVQDVFNTIALGLPIVYISGIVTYSFCAKTKLLQRLKKLSARYSARKYVSLEMSIYGYMENHASQPHHKSRHYRLQIVHIYSVHKRLSEVQIGRLLYYHKPDYMALH